MSEKYVSYILSEFLVVSGGRVYLVFVTLSLPGVEAKHLLFATYFYFDKSNNGIKYLTTDRSWALTKQTGGWPEKMIWPHWCFPAKGPFCVLVKPYNLPNSGLCH